MILPRDDRFSRSYRLNIIRNAHAHHNLFSQVLMTLDRCVPPTFSGSSDQRWHILEFKIWLVLYHNMAIFFPNVPQFSQFLRFPNRGDLTHAYFSVNFADIHKRVKVLIEHNPHFCKIHSYSVRRMSFVLIITCASVLSVTCNERMNA